jgi:hypothetical protein
MISAAPGVGAGAPNKVACGPLEGRIAGVN